MPKLRKGSPAYKRMLERRTPKGVRRAKARLNAWHHKRTLRGQDIGRIPKVKYPARRAKATGSFRFFCEIYFPEIFYLPWSKDLLRVIGKIERVVLHHDTLAVAMPRGSGKTMLCLVATLWGVLTARHRFATYIGSVVVAAQEAVSWFKATLSENDRLLEDWPEVCFPIRQLDNEGRRCVGQRYKGKRTRITWGVDRIVLPTIPGSEVSGSIISTASLEGRIRGAWVRLPGGRVVRPTLAVCDDPQTRESARSQGAGGQTTFRLQVINEDVQGLAGPDAQTAILVPCTVICAGDLADQLLDRKTFPGYRGERTKRFYSWPTNKSLWEEYRELREREMRGDEDHTESTEFYRSRMATCGRPLDEARACETCPRAKECMDCGAVVDWAARKDDPRNLSAVQAAMHSLYKYKASGFASEFQNEPLTNEGERAVLTADVCARKVNGQAHLIVPTAATALTMGVDVQQSSLWYVLVAWEPNFTGSVIDYGVWPRQVRKVFTMAEIVDSAHNLQTAYPGRGVEGTIQAGLEELVAGYLARDFERAGGAGLMRISKMLVDSGRWPSVIAAVKRKCGGAVMDLSRGVGIKAGNPPMAARKRKPGEKSDPLGHWYMPSVMGTREFPTVVIDVNWWKSFVHSALLTAAGDPGAMTIFGDAQEQHGLFASHITAETYVTPVSPRGVPVDEWTLRPTHPDNHWLDATVYATAAASVMGIAPAGLAGPRGRVIQRTLMSYEQIVAQRNRP